MSKNSDIAISVKKVSKDFSLPHERGNSLKSTVVGVFRAKDKRVEIQHALRDISFEIKKGEFFGIVGRNGSGKSTLLKILAGIYQPTKGSVEIQGRLVPFIELGVGFNPELTGRENVYLNGALLGFSRKEISAKYTQIVDFAELEKFMDQKLKNYSSGMQVRLAFSVATVLAESDILLIDEVLAVGDAAFQRKCFDYFKSIKKLKKTVVFVSHDMNAIKEYCDRGILINDSRLELDSTTEEIAKLYTKLFNQQIEKQEQVDESKRWGSKEVTITSRPTVELIDDYINVNIPISSKHDDAQLVVGVSVENSFGQVVVGTNTKKLQISSSQFIDVSNIKFKIPNIFSSGKYRLTVALHHYDDVTIYDWWSDCTQFTINNPHNTPYIVSPSCKVEVS